MHKVLHIILLTVAVFLVDFAYANLTGVTACQIERILALYAIGILSPIAGHLANKVGPFNFSLGGSAREEGEIKWFNQNKGFGFITTDDGSDVFLHTRALREASKQQVKPGARVSFKIEHADKGPQAVDVDLN